ncbi:hypothetical protein DDK22_29855 [Cupriavidus necator]|uniref:Uncharacterized protein n=1 Tax=Cupriavidus necator TaxID=106590 RepID=A0A367PAC9_CUPNE|nr:hypothetical protein DDK22_29855 [Cupriavidus necator]
MEKDKLRRRALHKSEAVRASYATLSAREAEVMGMAIAGRLNKQIAFDASYHGLTGLRPRNDCCHPTLPPTIPNNDSANLGRLRHAPPISMGSPQRGPDPYGGRDG